MTLFLTTANQFNAEKGGRGGESLTISLLLLFFRHLNKAAAAGVYQHPQREEPDKYSPVAGGEGGKVMDAIHKTKGHLSGDLLFPVSHRQCCRFDGRYVVSAGEIARSLEAQDAKFSDDFMEQFHDDFLTQVQFITLFL